MEMEAGGPTSKKRRMASPGVDEDGGGATDRMSHLSDAILGEIISLLPTKDGARTQILASRWRHLWRSAPLNLDFHDVAADMDALAGVVSRIISTHPGPGRRFCVPAHFLGHRGAAVDAWLRSPALDNLQELEFWLGCQLPEPLAPPPPSAFRFSSTLRVVTIGKCHLPDSMAQSLHFPQLKQLGLEQVSISECTLHRMIAGCPALECLLIYRAFGFRHVRINSLSLRSIGVRVEHYYRNAWRHNIQFEELIIENAPCLERLLHLEPRFGQTGLLGLHISVISAPKLETLGCLSCDKYSKPSRLSFGSTVFQGLHIDSLTMVVRTVKILAVYLYNLSLDMVIDLMTCFPCLEKLYIQKCKSRGKNLWRRKHRNLIRCLDICLKTVVLENYVGTKSEVDFVTFFVLNAGVLELMTLVSRNNEEFTAEQQRKLQLNNRASRDAHFNFTTHSCLRNVLDIKHVYELDLTDPFECRC